MKYQFKNTFTCMSYTSADLKFKRKEHQASEGKPNSFCTLRDKLSTAKGPDSGLENAVVKWAADFLGEPSSSSVNLGRAFKICVG